MTVLVLNLALAVVWAAMIEPFSPLNLLLGWVIGYAVLSLVSRSMGVKSVYVTKVRIAVLFFLFFIAELVKANARVAYYTLSPLSRMRPGIVAIPLEEMSDLEMTSLANLITLTPGTLSVDVTDDRRTLFVHFMHVEDAERARREVKEGFEARVLELLR